MRSQVKAVAPAAGRVRKQTPSKVKAFAVPDSWFAGTFGNITPDAASPFFDTVKITSHAGGGITLTCTGGGNTLVLGPLATGMHVKSVTGTLTDTGGTSNSQYTASVKHRVVDRAKSVVNKIRCRIELVPAGHTLDPVVAGSWTADRQTTPGAGGHSGGSPRG